MGTISGELTLPSLFFASRLKWHQLLKNKIYSLRSKFFPVGVDPIWKSCVVHGAVQEVAKVVPLEKKNGENVV